MSYNGLTIVLPSFYTSITNMKIDYRKYKNVQVQTQSGQVLGSLADFELETDTGKIEKYIVKSGLSLPGIWEKKLVIDKDQVISFDAEKLIVADQVVKEQEESIPAVEKVDRLDNPETVITSKN